MGAGHPMYMDNPREFAKCVRNAIEPVAKGQPSSAASTASTNESAAGLASCAA